MSRFISAALQPAVQPLARLTGAQGYRIEGDAMLLQAQLDWLPGAAVSAGWSLQLWALPLADAAQPAAAVKVAELALDPAAGAPAAVEGWTLALPPAGDAARQLWLLLVEGDTQHDQCAFDLPEQFVQPQFHGVSYALDAAAEQVCLSAAVVRNPRPADNCSGTLALELWALDQPYSGGSFSGLCLARAELGTLAGQSGWSELRCDVPLLAPLPADLRPCLMLREWTAAGYICRDYRQFELQAEAQAPTEVAAPAAVEAAAVAEPPPAAPAEAKVAAKPAKAAPAVTAVPRVSINRATEEQLAAVKGIGKAVARNIVNGRPYTTLDALIDVRGIGAKTLTRLRDLLQP
ncbi:MAG: hypothetical protein RJA44_1038 [Pseudomonadota bacterium]